MRDRFDIELLDDVNPFEIDDDNLPHMFKHGPGDSGVEVGLDTLDEIYIHDEPRFYEAGEDGPADWLMLGHVSGEVLTVPLAPPRSSKVSKCRPIGLYKASVADCAQYYSDLGRWRG